MEIEQLKPIVEAALLAASQPLNLQQLVDLFTEEEQVDRERLARTLEALQQDCEGRGVELREVASGFRYQVRQNVHPWVARMWTEKPSRYSRALLETLALIAYRQPITRPEIEQIRGVVVSSNIIKTLEEREWIRVVGYRDVPGKPALFGTTRAFLDYFNLRSLDELPPLSEIRDMEDPQMRLADDSEPVRVIKDLPIDPEAEAEAAAQAAEQADEPGAPADASPEAGTERKIHHETQAGHEEPSEQELPADPTPATPRAGETHEPAAGSDETDAAGTAEAAEIPAAGSPETGPDTPAAEPGAAHEEPAEQELPADPAAAALHASDDAPAASHPTPATADEAADRADAESGDAEQDTEEHRA